MSTLVTNTITGLSTAANITIGSTPVVSASANSLTIRGEGSAQTSVQQGLAKLWMNLDGSGTIAILDSFNVSGATDNGTGDSGHNFTNNMANIHYVGSGMGVHDGGSYSTFMSYDHDDPFTTAQATVNQQLVNQNLHDAEPVNTMYAGELA